MYFRGIDALGATREALACGIAGGCKGTGWAGARESQCNANKYSMFLPCGKLCNCEELGVFSDECSITDSIESSQLRAAYFESMVHLQM